MTRPLPLQKIIRITGIVLSLIVGICIIVLSLLPPAKMAGRIPSWIPFADKGAHTLAYAAMGFSLFMACIRIPGSGRTPTWKRYMSGTNLRLTSWSGFAAMEVLVIGILLGFGIELLQPLTGRSREFADLCADLLGLMVGVALGLLVLHLLSEWFAGRPWLYDPGSSGVEATGESRQMLTVTSVLADALASAAIELPPDAVGALERAKALESQRLDALLSNPDASADAVQEQVRHCRASLGVFEMIERNLALAKSNGLPMCQDTGMFDVFVDIGKDCPASLAEIETAIYKAAELAVDRSCYRRSVVAEPVYDRKNTGTNLPPLITWRPVEGEDLRISVLLKGFGSENCCSVRMLNPTGGEKAVIDGVLDIVRKAGGKPCPPVFLGVGIGGTMEHAAVLSKRALLREVGEPNPDPRYAELEHELLDAVQSLGIGAGGLGGSITALSVAVETSPTHIAGMPVAVSINCWADRKVSLVFSQWERKTLKVLDLYAGEDKGERDV